MENPNASARSEAFRLYNDEMRTPYLASPEPEPQVAHAAALIADAGRARMLLALLDGRRLSASELAMRGGVSPSAASAHLAKLVEGGLLNVERSGRQRLFGLANAEIGHALEALARVAKPARIVALRQNLLAAELQEARSCYDHRAGRLGVAITDSLVARGVLELDGLKEYRLTPAATAFFATLDIDVADLRKQSRHFARQCIDWSERRPHLAGALGAAVRERLLQRAWIERHPSNRAIRITPAGRIGLAERFGLR
jgi:DNA-binding transcriptional ArsR family regulator